MTLPWTKILVIFLCLQGLASADFQQGTGHSPRAETYVVDMLPLVMRNVETSQQLDSDRTGKVALSNNLTDASFPSLSTAMSSFYM